MRCQLVLRKNRHFAAAIFVVCARSEVATESIFSGGPFFGCIAWGPSKRATVRPYPCGGDRLGLLELLAGMSNLNFLV